MAWGYFRVLVAAEAMGTSGSRLMSHIDERLYYLNKIQVFMQRAEIGEDEIHRFLLKSLQALDEEVHAQLTTDLSVGSSPRRPGIGPTG